MDAHVTTNTYSVSITPLTTDTAVEQVVTNVTLQGPDTVTVAVSPVSVPVTITTQPTQVTVSSIGIQGPKGDAGTQSVTYPASAALSGQRVIIIGVDEKVYYADKNTPTHAVKVLGVTQRAAGLGTNADIQTYGIMVEPSWNWVLDNPIFLGNTGVLTQTIPVTGFILIIGFPITAQSMFIDIDKPIILS